MGLKGEANPVFCCIGLSILAKTCIRRPLYLDLLLLPQVKIHEKGPICDGYTLCSLCVGTP